MKLLSYELHLSALSHQYSNSLIKKIVIDRLINTKYFTFFFFLVISILSKEFIFTSIEKFYLFQVDRTAFTKGVITESLVVDEEDRLFDCKVLYWLNDKQYKITERVSASDTNTNFKSGDSIRVDYNVRKPWKGTIRKTGDRTFEFFAAVFMIAMFIYSGYGVIQDLYLKFKAQKEAH